MDVKNVFKKIQQYKCDISLKHYAGLMDMYECRVLSLV